MSMVPKCEECDAYVHKPHNEGCSFIEKPAPPMPPDEKMRPYYTVRAANYLAQARAAEIWGQETLAAARAAGHEVIGDMIIVRDINNEGTDNGQS